MKVNKTIKQCFYFALITVASVCVLNSCSKDENNVSNNDSKVLNDFRNVINNNTNYTSNRKSSCVNFEMNPFDSIGIKHNATVKHFFEEGSLSGDISSLLQGLKKYANVEFTEEPGFYPEMIKSLKNKVYKEDMKYNPEFINTVGSHIPDIEKALVNSYFESLTGIKDVNQRISISKDAELFILDNKDLKDESKKRILTTFALYRHSTSFWDDKTNPQGLCMRQCDIIDAIGYYIATHGDFEDGVMEDGAAVNNYAATFSLIVGWLLWPFSSSPCN